jgi:hypothetical protein
MSISKIADCFKATFYLTGTVFFVLNIWQLAIWFNWLWQMRRLGGSAGPII